MTPISPDLSILWPISPDILTRSWLTLNFQTEETNTSFSIHWSKKLVETFFYLFPAKQFLRNRQKKGILGWTFISWWTLINFQQNFQGRRLLHTGRLLIWTDFPGWTFIPSWSSIRQWRAFKVLSSILGGMQNFLVFRYVVPDKLRHRFLLKWTPVTSLLFALQGDENWRFYQKKWNCGRLFFLPKKIFVYFSKIY